MPTGDLPARFGYTDAYTGPPVDGYSPESPNVFLAATLQAKLDQGYSVASTTQLDISTVNQGGISNIAMVGTNTPTTRFDATWWIETLIDAQGNTSMQLQYSQRTLMSFPIESNAPGQTIVWPHINVNTLTLQQ